MGPSKESLFLLYKAFFRLLLTYASSGWFPFLNVTNITKSERLYQVASRTIIGCLSSSPILPLLFEASLPPLRVTLTHFIVSSYERAICFPTSSISDLARLIVKPRLCRSSWRAFASSTRSCFLIPLLGSFSCLSSISSLESAFVHGGVHPFLLMLALLPSSLFPSLTLSPHDLVLCTNGSVRFPVAKGGSGVLANCFSGTEATLSLSAGLVY